ncbi:MAG: hypothetical protein J5994_01620 [Ruminococcus sp.]|nr:hypothetical protein [Ruminococcus sp.]
MLLFFPKKYKFETSLSPKKVMRKLEGDLIEYRPSMNVLSTSKLIKKYWTDSIYYGRHSSDRFEVYYHRPKRRDGGGTGFYGRVEKTENGSMIKGVFRKPIYAYIFWGLWTLVMLACALGTYAAGEKTGALIILGIAAAGSLIVFWDSSLAMICSYLDGFPEAAQTINGDDKNEKA